MLRSLWLTWKKHVLSIDTVNENSNINDTQSQLEKKLCNPYVKNATLLQNLKNKNEVHEREVKFQVYVCG